MWVANLTLPDQRNSFYQLLRSIGSVDGRKRAGQVILGHYYYDCEVVYVLEDAVSNLWL